MRTSIIKDSDEVELFWSPGIKSYINMIRMEPKEAAISIGGAILIVLIILLLAILPCMFLDPIVRTKIKGVEQKQLSQDVKSYFKYRLAYHGLDKRVSVVYDFPERPYFERNGKICRF